MDVKFLKDFTVLGKHRKTKETPLSLYIYMYICIWLVACSVAQSCPTPVIAWTRQAPLSMGFPKQEYWSGLPFPPPGDLPDPGIELTSLVSPALVGRFFTTEQPMCCAVLSHFSRVWLLVTLWRVACEAPLSMGFSRYEYWSRLPTYTYVLCIYKWHKTDQKWGQYWFELSPKTLMKSSQEELQDGYVSILLLFRSLSATCFLIHFGVPYWFILEKAMAPHSSNPAWKIPWTEEPGRLQSMGSRRVRQDWATSLSLFIFMHWRRKWQPTPAFLPGESQGWGSLVGCHLQPDSYR